jgi:hypothetical protein
MPFGLFELFCVKTGLGDILDERARRQTGETHLPDRPASPGNAGQHKLKRNIEMNRIDLNDVDASLLDDLSADMGDIGTFGAFGTFEAFEAFADDRSDASASNRRYHILYSAEIGRGGIVLVGSGSSGQTSWTDATSAQDVLTRYLTDSLLNRDAGETATRTPGGSP